MNAISMNSENSKTFSLHSLLLNLADKMNLRRGNMHVALSYLSIFYTLKNIKKSYGNSKFKNRAQHWLTNLNCLMDHTLYQTFKNILSILSKKMEHWFISHQNKYMSTKLRIELHSKLRRGNPLNFQWML